MPTVSLLNGHVFVFVSVVILGIILISVYKMVIPEQTVPYNFNPFPNVAPTALPDPSRQEDKCWDKLTSCDLSKPNQCSSCSGGSMSYTCTEVRKGQAKRHFNGIDVPEGTWCLPNDSNPDPLCNPHTGRWIWTADQAYCEPLTGKNQCWKCECLYPDLYAGSEGGCMTQLACKNDSIYLVDSDHNQDNNKLVGTACSPFPGKVWDPMSTADDTVLNYTPYDKDANGNPFFTCSCNNKAGNNTTQFFKQLPGDPFTCHVEPCYRSIGSSIPDDPLHCISGALAPGSGALAGSCKETCSGCSCTTGYAVSPSGKYKNTCVSIQGACGAGADFDSNTKSCLCGELENSHPRKCKSKYTGVNMDDISLPDCKNPQNALGSECYNPCNESNCNGAPCISCGPGDYLHNEMCRMGVSADGKSLELLPDPSVIHYVCDCGQKDGAPPGYAGWGGPTCSDGCYGGGKRVWDSEFGGTTYISCSQCCAMSSTYHGSSWDQWYNYSECNSGRPDKDHPIDPTCTPVKSLAP